MACAWQTYGGPWVGRCSTKATGRLFRFMMEHKKITITVAVIAGGFKIWQVMNVRKLRAKWDNIGRDVVVLHTIKPGNTVPSITPFALKLETFFRLMDIKYEYDYAMPMGPKNKVPWITLNGTDYTDSELIVEKLQTHFRKYPDADVPAQDRAVGQAMRVMVEEHLYWGLVSWRYLEDDMKALQKAFDMPFIMMVMFKMGTKYLKKMLYIQGLGRHSISELHSLLKADVAALSNYLGDKEFMYGSEPHVVDCAVFGMLAQILYTCPDSVYIAWMQGEYSNLSAYTERMRLRLWPDWEQRVKKPMLIL
uniref:Failed axon connections homolog n=1 Tax=Hirondellea gigas TaxID=1518452 RepID=A0A2P2I3E1_9CRUS